VIEHADQPSKYYPHADRVVVVPKSFQCYVKAKARALEYARRYRRFLVEIKQIPERYLIVQGDDDSTPSEELLYESLFLDIDLISAIILPRSDSGSKITRVTDYQRLYACTCSCMFAINAGIPVWGHGEAMIYSHKVDSARSGRQSWITKYHHEGEIKPVCVFFSSLSFPTLIYLRARYMGSNGGVTMHNT
jgi:hypothetical protein